MPPKSLSFNFSVWEGLGGGGGILLFLKWGSLGFNCANFQKKNLIIQTQALEYLKVSILEVGGSTSSSSGPPKQLQIKVVLHHTEEFEERLFGDSVCTICTLYCKSEIILDLCYDFFSFLKI